MNGPQDCVEEVRKEYEHRRDVMVKGLHEIGWMVENPKASMYIWAELPDYYKPMGSVEFANHLLDKAKVAVSPGVGFGEYGEGFVRIALIENVDRIRQALRGIKKMFIEDGLLETASHKRQSVTRRWKGAHMPSEAEANAKPKVTLKPEEVPHITTKSEGLKKKGKKVTAAKAEPAAKKAKEKAAKPAKTSKSSKK